MPHPPDPRRRAGGPFTDADLHGAGGAEEPFSCDGDCFRQIYEHANTGIALADLHGRFLHCNPAYCELIGYSEAQLCGRTIQSLVHPDDLPAQLAQIERLVTGAIPHFAIESRYLRRDGRPLWVHIFFSLLPGRPGRLLALFNDITERKLSGPVLAEREARYRAVIETADDGFCMLDEQGRILEVNRAYARRSGYSREELLRMRIPDLEAQETPEEVRRRLGRLKLRGSELFESRHRARDGTLWPVEVHAAYWPEAGGYFFAFIRDITERHQAAADLRESEARFRATFEQAAVGIAHVSPEGRWLRVNGRLCEITGYGREELLGMTFHDITHPEDHELDRLHAEGLIAGHIPTCTLEKRYLRREGGIVWVSVTASLLRKPDGTPDYFISVIEEISQRRAAAEELRLRESELRQAQQLAAIGSWRWDSRHGTRWSEELFRIVGRGPQMLTAGTPALRDCFTPQSWERIVAEAREMHDRGGSCGFEAEVVRPDGSRRTVFIRGEVTRDAQGAMVGLHGTVQDITERRRLEKTEQEHRNRMDDLLRQQVAVHTAAAFAHELNQPLVAISAYGEVALRMLNSGAPDPERLARAIEGCHTQAQRAGRVLHQMIDQLEKGEIEKRPFDLNALLREVIVAVREKGIYQFQAVLDLEPQLPPVLGNRMQTERVLINLLRNGAEAMHEGAVPWAVFVIQARGIRERGMARVTVRDSGPGLDEQTARRVFEPFFTTKAGGIGLGLAISRSLIEAQDGQLWVEPDDRPGAAFHFTLPFATPGERA